MKSTTCARKARPSWKPTIVERSGIGVFPTQSATM
jgi:hypothetical protein